MKVFLNFSVFIFLLAHSKDGECYSYRHQGKNNKNNIHFPNSSNKYRGNSTAGDKPESKQTNELLQYLQVDDIDSGWYDIPAHLPANSCTRPCQKGQTRTCYYQFFIEAFAVMGAACDDCINNVNDCYNKGCVTADGFEKGVLTINRRMPGPSIQVCEGDMLVLDVKNMMPGRSTTIHWHGLKQKNYKFMDGTVLVTQCPFTEGQTFRYTFKAEDPGLDFYHSHDGLQKVDGVVGSLVIRQPKSEDPNGNLYDFDLPSHVIVIQDWYHMTADSMYPGLRYQDTEMMAASYLIQGRGQYILRDGSRLANTPIAEFDVTQGYRYVFRIVAGTCFECQYILTVEKHDMIIIRADAQATKPYRVDSLTMSPGERYTVVLNCDRPVGIYWIQVRGVGLCTHLQGNQVAILRYRGSWKPVSEPPTYNVTDVNRPGITISPVNSLCTRQTRERDGPCIQDLRSANRAAKAILKPQPDVRLIWALGFYFFENKELFESNEYYKFLQSPFTPVSSTINGITYSHPTSPLLSQREDVSEEQICPAGGYRPKTWNRKHRECVHIMKVPVNKVIEIVVIDIGSYDPNQISHSMHLHGYDLHILEMGAFDVEKPFNQSYVQLMEYLDSKNRKKIPEDVVTKDTFPVTAGGYVVTRMLSDNTGYWFFHCHFTYHLETGMSGVLQVGDHDTFPPPPKGFPKCGSFLPDL